MLTTGDEGLDVEVASDSGVGGGGPFRIEYDAGVFVKRCDRAGRGAWPVSGLW